MDELINLTNMALQQSHKVEPHYIWSHGIVEKITPKMIQDRMMFSPIYKEKEDKQQEEWKKYCAKHGNGMTICRTHKFRNLLRGGLPHNLRGRFWMICSGGYALMI